MARRALRGIKQPHPLGSVPSRSGVSQLTVLPGSVTTSTGVKISELLAAAAANATDQIETNQNGVSRRLTLEQVRGLIEADEPSSIGDYGAVGDGVTDDTSALEDALAAAAAGGLRLTGDGKTYAVSGNITLPDGTWLQDIRFVQLDPENAGRRTLYAENLIAGITLIRVSVDRNGTPASISTLADAAGIWMSGDEPRTASIYFEDVEVYGDGPGYGILLNTFDAITLLRPHVHDMAWYTLADPGSGGEKIVGIYAGTANSITINNPQIHRLMGWWGTTGLKAYQSDGINIPNVLSAVINGGRITHCGEGFDGSGSTLSRNVWFNGTSFEDCELGHKTMAHRDSGAIGCRFIRCGTNAIVVASADSSPPAVTPRNLQYADCFAVDTGATHTATAYSYRVDYAGAVVAALLPDDIRFDNCASFSHMATVTGSIAGTVLTVTATSAGMATKGQNIAGSGVTGGTYIVGPGKLASLIGSIAGTALTVGTLVYGAVAVGQSIYGPGIAPGTTIVSGSGSSWVISASHTLTSVALLLSLDVADTYTVTPSQTVSSTTLTMTGNTSQGYIIETTLVDNVTVNNGTVQGSTGDSFHNFTKRVSSWQDDGTQLVLGGLETGTLGTSGSAAIGDSIYNFARFNVGGGSFTSAELRDTTNGVNRMLRLQSPGINNPGQGSAILFQIGTDYVTPIDAGQIAVLATDTWAAPANQSAKLSIVLTHVGTPTTGAELSIAGGLTVGPTITALYATAVGAGANTQAFIKASTTANLGIYYGTGDPTFSAAKGSLYSKVDATTTTTRLWVNTNGSTTWANFTSSA